MLSDVSTRSPKDINKDKAKEELASILEELAELQNLLYAEAKYAVLVVIQGMDASGKDGVIRNVFGKLNPQGVQVKSFKAPTAEELGHDFLWRIHLNTPEKGIIKIFNRSHYEDVLITRVHKWIDTDTASKRMGAINDFERLLTEHNSTIILKFYLHISREEQKKRLEERMTDPTKKWKYNENDFKESELWNDYMSAYEDCFSQCNQIPWTIVPSDQNWYKEYVIAKALRDKLKGLSMQYPDIKRDRPS